MSAANLLPFPGAIEALPRKRFTRDEVDRLTESGFFEGQRWELIDGELIDKMGQNPPHASGIRRVHVWLVSILGANWVGMQLPIEASSSDRDRSLPEPDVSVIQPNAEHDNRHPRGGEVLLVVEVSDTSVAFDLSRKAILYARAGVREYWVLDLVSRRLVVHRQPDGSTYRLIQLFSEDDTVSMEGRSESVRVSEVLPTRA